MPLPGGAQSMGRLPHGYPNSAPSSQGRVTGDNTTAATGFTTSGEVFAVVSLSSTSARLPPAESPVMAMRFESFAISAR
jgi:hypothetical protein